MNGTTAIEFRAGSALAGAAAGAPARFVVANWPRSTYEAMSATESATPAVSRLRALRRGLASRAPTAGGVGASPLNAGDNPDDTTGWLSSMLTCATIR